MRLEATLPESRGAAALELAAELGLTKSQLVDEAITLFLAAVMEMRRGRRLMTVDPQSQQPAREIVTPTLSALEWAMQPEQVKLSPAALKKMHELTAAPAKPGARLRSAAKRHAR